MELEFAQKKYPEFVYESCSWRVDGSDFFADFKFRMGDIRFDPVIAIHGVDPARLAALDPKIISNLIFNMGLAEMPTYWKAACPFKIVIEAGYLDKKQVQFWQDLIANMGQFFYENNLPFITPEIKVLVPKAKTPVFANKVSEKYLIPLGGGKDSLVTLEVIRDYLKKKIDDQDQSGENIITFTLNVGAVLSGVITAANANNIFVERSIDPRLLDLNRQGFFNGHTPFSSILSFLGVTLAVLFDCQAVAISQERSSNEGNVIYRDRIINHQYSKTLEFENKFRDYSKKYLAKEIGYFSFLRPLYELQVAKIFAGYPQYFKSFLSCNKPFTINQIKGGGTVRWCCACPKCLSVYSMLYSFVGQETAVQIFGQDLFKNAGLMPTMRELLGEGDCKPFECVGTFAETRAALYLSLVRAERENSSGLPVLLQIFRDGYLKLYPDIEKESQNILAAWNSRHNLPKDLQNALKNALKAS